MFARFASPFGVEETVGNVWEWTSDWFTPYEGNMREHRDYGETHRIAKGGSWFTYRNYARSGSRYPFNPLVDYRGVSPIGFRLVEELQT
jgi:formylglycine-generating enzyme required for sulfatase activity